MQHLAFCIALYLKQFAPFFLQYPRGLGKTVAELNLNEEKCFKAEKTKFSMMVPAVEEHLEKFQSAKSVIIFGVEVGTLTLLAYIDFKFLS